MNLLSLYPYTPKQSLYVVHQNNFELTDAMSEYECQMWILEHESRLANLQYREVRYETGDTRNTSRNERNSERE